MMKFESYYLMRSSRLYHPSLAQNEVTIPANVDEDCCRLCRFPLAAPYFLHTAARGTSFTKSNSARAV